MRGCDGFVDRPAAHANAHQRRNPGLLHRHAVHGIRCLRRRARVVRNDYELGLGLESIEHANEVANVLIIQWGVDFVKQAERAWLGQEYSEEQGQGNKGLFTAGQQVDALCALAAWRGVDLDVALERTFRILESEITFAAAEECHEDVAKVLAHPHEGLEEELSCSCVDFANCLVQRVLRRVQVVALSSKEAEAPRLFLVLLDGERIYGTEC